MPVSKTLRSSKEKIFSAALDEFAEGGLAGARVDNIAARAGINKAMIYYHFDSKEALYDHILKTRLEAAVADLSGDMTEAMELEDILRTIALHHAKGLMADGRVSRILLHELAAGGLRIQRILPDLTGKEKLRTMIVGLIEEGKQAGKYRNVDTRQAVISFIGMSMFYLILAPMVNQIWGIENESEFIQQRIEAILDLFMHGLETGQGPLQSGQGARPEQTEV
ncbi:MAG: TetR/AcrR family transcriptional regulator [bacterium]|jgi:TetR/AcrR family transcriptional regulator